MAGISAKKPAKHFLQPDAYPAQASARSVCESCLVLEEPSAQTKASDLMGHYNEWIHSFGSIFHEKKGTEKQQIKSNNRESEI